MRTEGSRVFRSPVGHLRTAIHLDYYVRDKDLLFDFHHLDFISGKLDNPGLMTITSRCLIFIASRQLCWNYQDTCIISLLDHQLFEKRNRDLLILNFLHSTDTYCVQTRYKVLLTSQELERFISLIARS